MRVPATFTLALALAAQAGTTAVDPIPFNRPLPHPLYEEYPIIRDFRLNQTVEGAIRGTCLGLLLGGLVATIAVDPEEEVIPIVTMLVISAGGTLGGLAGSTGGYLRGRSWERRKSRGEIVHARKKQVGIELDAGSSLTGGGDSRDYSHFALAWKLPNHQRWAPDEYQVQVGRQSWHIGENASGFANHGHEDRRGLRVLKTFRDALVNPFIGLGGGYSLGTAYDYGSGMPTEVEGQDFSTAYAEALAGVEVNVFDFFHARIQAVYEPFGPYRLLSRHGDYDPLTKFTIRSSIGASLL